MIMITRINNNKNNSNYNNKHNNNALYVYYCNYDVPGNSIVLLI